MRVLIVFLGLVWFGVATAACGGSVANPISQQPGDAGTDAAAGDGALANDVVTSTDATSPPPTDAIVPPSEDGPVTVIDAGQACAPPNDSTKSALCITVVPEKIMFTSDSNFDGKGTLIVQVFDTSTPDLPDGGSVTSLATVTYSGATQIDLSQPVPAIRFDGLPSETVYARAVFVDPVMPTANLTAGFWIGGYDLSNGIQNQTHVLPTMLSAGNATAIAMDLVAVRALTVSLTLGAVKPAGNGEGPAVFIVTPTQTPTNGSALFGLGESQCARVDGNRTAEVTGFVIGKGPYFVGAVLDDFGLGDGGIALPPGALTSLEVTSMGGIEIPPSDALTYPANAYKVTGAVTLGLVVGGDAGTDTVTCP